MEIYRGFTLSQFVDMQPLIIAEVSGVSKPEHISSINVDTYNTASLHAYGRIHRYNAFLNKNLSQDMIVNPFDGPMNIMSKTYSSDRRKFEEAEKLVIIDDDRVYIDDNYPGVVCIKGGGVIPFGFKVADLFQAVKSPLTLKNVVI